MSEIIGAAEREAIAALVAFAQEYANWLRPPADNWDERRDKHVCMLPVNEPSLMCIFTFLAHNGYVSRQLSISLMSPAVEPGMELAGKVAVRFGFTGWASGDEDWPDDWHVIVCGGTLLIAQFVRKDPS